MTDWEYLMQAVKQGHLCPKCWRELLTKDPKTGAVCPDCGEHYTSWLSLFFLSAKYWQWSSLELAWTAWLSIHPDYEKSHLTLST
jgi:predicted amidophosphoribosyltransferase